MRDNQEAKEIAAILQHIESTGASKDKHSKEEEKNNEKKQKKQDEIPCWELKNELLYKKLVYYIVLYCNVLPFYARSEFSYSRRMRLLLYSQNWTTCACAQSVERRAKKVKINIEQRGFKKR